MKNIFSKITAQDLLEQELHATELKLLEAHNMVEQYTQSLESARSYVNQYTTRLQRLRVMQHTGVLPKGDTHEKTINNLSAAISNLD